MSVQLQMVTSAGAELTRWENDIEKLRSFGEVGTALDTIREDKLFTAAGHESFAEYLKERWPSIKANYAGKLIHASRVLYNLGTNVPILPLTEGQARPLTALEGHDQIAVWRRALDAASYRQPPEQLVRDVLAAFLSERAAGAPESADTVAAPFYTVDAWNALPAEERARIIAEEPLGSKTKFNRTNENVEWAYWTWNPVTGCDHGCDYCYARDLAQRYYTDLPSDERFTPVLRPTRLHAPRLMTVPDAYDPDDPLTIGEKNVFVCSMADLFGRWVPQDWIDAVFAEVVNSPEWNYLFLTKFPQRLAEQRWPENAWCGTTVDRQARVGTAERSFRDVTAGVKWLSCEPMLERLTFTSLEMFDWVVIGGSSKSSQTPEFQPPWEWIEHLTNQARAAGCKVYWKPNLKNRPREYPGAETR